MTVPDLNPGVIAVVRVRGGAPSFPAAAVAAARYGRQPCALCSRTLADDPAGEGARAVPLLADGETLAGRFSAPAMIVHAVCVDALTDEERAARAAEWQPLAGGLA